MNVYIEYSNRQYEQMFKNQGFTVVGSVDEADVVQFTGGSDVIPSLYGQASHPYTHSDPARDDREVELFWYCLGNDIPMLGICRGAQFLNVMSGGSMKQHVDGHATGSLHLMVDVNSGEMLSVTSTHHQMMIPGDLGTVLAVASESTFFEIMTYEGVQRKQSNRGDDIEAVWYPDTECLCYQPHPEYLEKGHPCQEYYFDLINEFIS